MSEITLYNALTKLGLEPKEAERAVADIASSKEVATKADLKTGLAKLEGKITAVEGRVNSAIVKLEGRVKAVEGKVAAIQWMVGILVVLNAGIFIKLFMG